MEDNFTHIAIIGNGFDLNLGLKTGYNDFISSDEFTNLLNVGNHLADHLKSKHNLHNWIDIENELTFYSNKQNHFKEALDSFQKDFTAISDALKVYLKEIPLNNLDRTSRSFKLLEQLKDNDFLIFDFNYTKSAETILLDLGINIEEISRRLIKVHGSLDEDDIIFGVEDSALTKPEHVFLRKAYKASFKAVKMYSHLKNFKELHIFGHSLGQTDHMYFKSYFETYSHINASTQMHKIVLYHFGEEAYTKLFMQLETLTHKNLTILRQNSNFTLVDTSK